MQSWNDPTSSQLDALKRSRVTTYRTQISWTSVEPNEPKGNCLRRCTHSYRWGRYDRLFGMLAKRGLQPMPVLLGTPSWARPQAGKPQNPPMAPRYRQAFYQFARAAARRYGPSSNFWRTRKPPVDGSVVGARYWQTWNEPNIKNYWNNRPSPSEYAVMVKGTHAAVKRGDKAATTILAGMPETNASGAILPIDFVRGMFRADSRIFESFYAVSLHPYATTPSKSIDLGVKPMRRALDDLLPNRVTRYMWITEIGWASGPSDGRFQVSEATQGRNLELFYNELADIRDSHKILGAVWFNLVDLRGADWWAERTGLIRSNGTKKPAWYRLNCVTNTSDCRR